MIWKPLFWRLMLSAERISLGIKQMDGDPFSGFVVGGMTKARHRNRRGQVTRCKGRSGSLWKAMWKLI